MTLTHGNDAEVLDGIGDALRAQADRVEGIAGSGASGMAVLVDAWAGPDLEVFDANWRGAQQQLDAAAQLLRAVGERAKEQAQQQRDGSGEGGGGSAPFGPRGGSKADAETPAVPHSDHDQEDLEIPIPDDGRPWTPQGLGYSDEQDLYVHSMYDHDNPGDGLLVIQPADGGPAQYVRIEGNDHYGGVTVDGDNVYVSGNGATEGEGDASDGSYIQRYSLAELQAAQGDDVTQPIDRHQVETGSTVTSHDGNLYVGRYENGEEGTIYEYALGPDGQLPSESDDWEPSNQWDAPSNMQGLVTDGDNFYVTQSHGPDDPSTLIRVDRGSNDFDDVGELSPLSQGVVIRDGHLVVTSESGAAPYRQDVLDSDSPWLPNVTENPVKPEDHLQERVVPDGSIKKIDTNPFF